MSRKITTEEFTAAMEAAVAERGADYVYPAAPENPDYDSNDYDSGPSLPDDYHNDHDGNCVYSTPDGTPACLIGLALSKLGLEVPEYGVRVGAVGVLRDHVEAKFPEGVGEAAQRAQGTQDAGKTWGEALAKYKERLSL